jgi:hypothetical protein
MLHKILSLYDPRATANVKRKVVTYAAAVTFIVASLGYYAFGYVSDNPLVRNVLSSKLSGQDYSSVALNTALDPVFGVSFWYFFLAALACCWKAARMDGKNLMSFSLIVLCLLITTLKGAFYHLALNPGFLILFLLMLKHRDLLSRR